MTVEEQANSEATIFALLVSSSGLAGMNDQAADAVLVVIRGIVLAAVALRQEDLLANGISPEEVASFKKSHMNCYDELIQAWIRQTRKGRAERLLH